MTMVYEIVIPIMDQTTESVVLARWLKAEGDSVRKGDIICEIETDKARVEIEAAADGILRQILIEAGTEIPPLTVVALLGGPDEALPTIDPYYRTHRAVLPPSSAWTTNITPSGPKSEAASTHPQKIIASPRARRLAEEHGLDLATIRGSGPNGRIQEEDVLQAVAESAPTVSPGMQAKVERVSQSWQTIPHFYTSITVDMSQVVAARAETNKQMTYTDFMLWATARTLDRHPTLNGHWRENRLLTSPQIHLGLVVQTDQGLVIVTLRNAGQRSLTEIAEERAHLIQQAHSGKIGASAMTEPTFTFSNVGSGHIDHFTAIISPPQVAILSVGSIQPRPFVVNSELTIRPTAVFTVGVDHRAVDGRQAAAFLEQLKDTLENLQ